MDVPHHETFMRSFFSSPGLNLKLVRIDHASTAVIDPLVANSGNQAHLTSLTLNCPTCTDSMMTASGINWAPLTSLKTLILTLPQVENLDLSSLATLSALETLHITAPIAKLTNIIQLQSLSSLGVIHLDVLESPKFPENWPLKELVLKSLQITDNAPVDLSTYSELKTFKWLKVRAPEIKLPDDLNSLELVIAEGYVPTLPNPLPPQTTSFALRNFIFSSDFTSWFPMSSQNLQSLEFENVSDTSAGVWPKLGDPLSSFTAIGCTLPDGYFAGITTYLRELTIINSTISDSASKWSTLTKVHYERVDLSGLTDEIFAQLTANSITLVSCSINHFIPFNSASGSAGNLLFLNLSSNIIGGSEPDFALWNNIESIDLSFNRLTWISFSFPPSLSALTYVNLANNSLSGNFLASNLNIRTLDLRNNDYSNLSFPTSSSELEEAYLDGNPWLTLPDAQSFIEVMPTLHTFTISNVDADSNSAPLPTFWADHPTIFRFEASSFKDPQTPYPNKISSPNLRILDLHDTPLTPSMISAFDLDSGSRFLNANFANTRANSTSFDSFSIWAYETIDISNNQFTGCMGSITWSRGSKVALHTLRINNNNFDGPLPNLNELQNLATFDASSNRFDVCTLHPFSSADPTAPITCNLAAQRYTSTCQCADMYPAATTCYATSCSPTEIPPEGVDTCASPSTATPTTTLTPTQVQNPCPGSAPSSSFFCNHTTGIWQNNVTITTPTLIIPPATSVVIIGDLNISTITFSSGSTVSVSGCVFIVGNVSLTLTEEDIKTLSQSKLFTLLNANTGNQTCLNSTDLSTLVVGIQTPNLKCKKLYTENKSHRDTLALTLSTSSSGCNVWWIILVSVLGGVLLLVVLIVLIVTFVPCAKAAVRPFWVRSKRQQEATPGAVA